MLWMLLASAISGLLLGLRFRVPALGAAAALMVLINIVAALTSGWSTGFVVFSVLVSLVALSCSYLIGLGLAFSWSRYRGSRRPTNASSNG